MNLEMMKASVPYLRALRSDLLSRVGKLPRQKLALLLAGIDIILGK